MDHLCLEEDDDVSVKPCLEPLRMYVKLIKRGKDAIMLAHPEKKRKKEHILNSPGFLSRYKNMVFNLQARP